MSVVKAGPFPWLRSSLRRKKNPRTTEEKDCPGCAEIMRQIQSLHTETEEINRRLEKLRNQLKTSDTLGHSFTEYDMDDFPPDSENYMGSCEQPSPEMTTGGLENPEVVAQEPPEKNLYSEDACPTTIPAQDVASPINVGTPEVVTFTSLSSDSF